MSLDFSLKLQDIKKLRIKLGLTQKELAKISGVSQSLIAKIESKNVDPTYSKIKKIFSALSILRQKTEIKISDIMIKKLISVTPETSLSDTIKIMRINSISQVPIIKNDQVTGIVTEASVLNSYMKKSDVKTLTAFNVAEPPPPIISEDSDIRVASQLLNFFSMVIVSKKGKVSGLITKSDIIKTYS